MLQELLKRKNYIMIVAIAFVAISLSGTTYSLFINVDNTDEFTYKTGILDLEFIEGSTINLNNTFPVSDTVGIKGEPYTLTIKNTGNLAYMFDIKMLGNDEDNVIDSDYIKVMVNDDKPFILKKENNILKKNIILYPMEEITLNVRIWLDLSTPNDELGKYFQANLVTNGAAFYKTLDESGANHPIMTDDMIPVYYDGNINKWKVADDANLDNNYEWYNYDASKWANSVIIKDSNKYIYDVSGNDKDILVSNELNVTSSDVILDNNVFKVNTSLNDTGSIVTRFKFNEKSNSNILMEFSNDNNIIYNGEKFIVNINGNSYESKNYDISLDKYYIICYTFSSNKISLYINGDKILDTNINNSINYGIVVYGNNTNITISDIYIYSNVLSGNVVSSNYSNNVVIVNDNMVCGYNDFYPMTLKDYYRNSSYGTIIKDNDISEFYVWIPRYKYMVWNIEGEDNYSSYDAYNNGINISFERYTYSSGTIYCSNNICYSDKEKTKEVTSLDNNKYYTHPAFTSLDKELYGLWVGKYELSSNCNLDSCLSSNLSFKILPSNSIWNNNYLSNYYKAIVGKNDKYHMIKNTEWGAVAYLSHSKYGVCKTDGCDYSLDSTTNNYYGIYNMNNNYSEFVMANYTNEMDNISLNNSHFGGMPILNSDYNLYYKNTFILGDATREISLNNSSNGGWYDNHSVFPDEINNWFIRGSNSLDNNKNGIFYYGASSDDPSEYITTRVVIR